MINSVKCKLSAWKRHAVIAIATALAPLCAFSQTQTRLQAFVSSTENNAYKQARKIEKLGAGPVIVREENGQYKVMTRAYNSLAEANFAKSNLLVNGFKGAFAVAEENDRDSFEKAETPFGKDLPKVSSQALKSLRIDFDKNRKGSKGNADLNSLEAKISHACELLKAGDDSLDLNSPLGKIALGYKYLNAGDERSAWTLFKEASRKFPDQPEAGYAELRCGYLMIRAKKSSADCLEQFRKIACGKVTATDEVRIEAMIRCAALYHRGKDLDTAEKAYEVIEQATTDQEVQAFARMNRAGIVLEKAWNGKASFADAREIADTVLRDFPNAHQQTRATAGVMAMETLCYEKKYREVLNRESAFCKEFKGTPEGSLGYYWIAVALAETGEEAWAADMLDEMMNEDYSSGERFKDIEIAPSARRLAIKLHSKLGNHSRVKQLTAMKQ